MFKNVFFFLARELRNKQYELEYLPFYTRATPWLIGLATGYILLKLQLKKIQIKLTTVRKKKKKKKKNLNE